MSRYSADDRAIYFYASHLDGVRQWKFDLSFGEEETHHDAAVAAAAAGGKGEAGSSSLAATSATSAAISSPAAPPAPDNDDIFAAFDMPPPMPSSAAQDGQEKRSGDEGGEGKVDEATKTDHDPSNPCHESGAAKDGLLSPLTAAMDLLKLSPAADPEADGGDAPSRVAVASSMCGRVCAVHLAQRAAVTAPTADGDVGAPGTGISAALDIRVWGEQGGSAMCMLEVRTAATRGCTHSSRR